jgi:hypothetical protein
MVAAKLGVRESERARARAGARLALRTRCAPGAGALLAQQVTLAANRR